MADIDSKAPTELTLPERMAWRAGYRQGLEDSVGINALVHSHAFRLSQISVELGEAFDLPSGSFPLSIEIQPSGQRYTVYYLRPVVSQ